MVLDNINQFTDKIAYAVEHSPIAIVITDIEGNIEYANTIFTKLSGYSSEEAIGKNLSIIKSGKTPPEVYKELWDTINSGNEWSGNLFNRKKSGELYWETLSISPIKDEKDNIINFIAYKRDITKHKEFEDKVTCLAQVLEESLNEIYIFDAKTLQFLLVNKGARLNLGYSIEELYNFTPLEIKPEFTAELFAEKIKPLQIGEKQKVVFETVHRRKNGSLYDVEVHLQLSTYHSIPAFVAIILDITDRKKMEEALLQSEKLKSMGTITAGISHEFNNILAIISGQTQLLEMNYKGNKELLETLSIIMKAADDGAKISGNMLKFTKTKPDTKEYVSFDIRDLIRHSIDFTKPRWKNEAQASGIDYKMDMEGMRRVPSIMCNLAEIREIFINIINNALDAMPEGGSVSFRTWSVDDAVFVSVTDNGEGMPENVRKNIFDPFFSTKGVEGTGLGMSMAYGIVTRHGGKIEVDSKIGKGTTFTIQFPTTNKRKKLMEIPDTKQETNIKSLRILVVDDEEAMRNILNQFLSRSGYTVKAIDNGADAINMAEGEDFDLVLCDLAMPNVFGYDVVKALNKLKKRPKIGIITGWSDDHVSDKDLKVDFYLKKPFKHSELARHINDVFDTNGG